MKKQLKETAVINELRGASAFFPRPAPAAESPAPPSQETAVRPTSTAIAEEPVRSVRGVRPVRRKKQRHPFDLYEDQVERLRWLAAEDRKAGGDGSMSRMVREALDQYLAKKTDEQMD